MTKKGKKAPSDIGDLQRELLQIQIAKESKGTKENKAQEQLLQLQIEKEKDEKKKRDQEAASAKAIVDKEEAAIRAAKAEEEQKEAAIKEVKDKEAADANATEEAEAKAKAEAEEKTKAEAEAKANAEAETKANAEAEAKAKSEEDIRYAAEFEAESVRIEEELKDIESTFYVLRSEKLEFLELRVNYMLVKKKGYFVYQGVQRYNNEFIQIVIKLQDNYGKEMWRIFDSLKGLFSFSEKDKESTLATDAIGFVLTNLGGVGKGEGDESKENGEKGEGHESKDETKE